MGLCGSKSPIEDENSENEENEEKPKNTRNPNSFLTSAEVSALEEDANNDVAVREIWRRRGITTLR